MTAAFFASVAALTHANTQLALKACPYREDFFKKLRDDPAGGPAASPAEFDAALDTWLASLAAIVATMEAFYKAGDYGKGL
jgi:hypothetical protein